MDALARLEPAARPMLRDVDDALRTLGAPGEHQVWSLLRRLRATPADAVGFFADFEPARLRAVACALRDQAAAYVAATIPAAVGWQGGAGEAYAARATSLAHHLRGDGVDSMAGRMEETACYVDETAGWYERSRDRMARALSDVLTSTQAITVRSRSAVGPGARSAEAVCAAADIGACVLRAAADALAEGRDVHEGWSGRLAELSYQAPAVAGAGRFDATIHLSQ